MKTAYQHVIIGSGQALGTLLGHLIATGESTAVIEGDRVGGTCVNTGCTPTKALVASARVAQMVRRASEYGISAGTPKIDFAAVRARMNSIRSNSGLVEWIEGAENVKLLRGWGRFVGPREIAVGEEIVTGERVYINAGTRPRIPDVPGLDSVPWFDHRKFLELTELPEHLIVVGGSYIGLEFAQMFKRFGSDVSVVERGTHLVSREDVDVSEAIRSILESEGIEVFAGARVTRVANAGGKIDVALEQGARSESISGSHLLMATGVVPNSDTLSVETGGIELDDRGYIAVDDFCRTSADGVFALGDINGRGAFTHTSVNDAEIVLDLMRGGTRTLSDRITTYGLFIDPPLGRVGMTEREARASGRNVLEAMRPMSKIARAREMGETQGFAKLLVDGDTDQLIGAAILGPGGDEVVNMLTAWMTGGLPCRMYRKSVLVHPTISELIPWILDTLKPVKAD